MANLTDRQQALFEWLQTQQSASIKEIETQFCVSPATAYRDARTLVQAQMAVKTSNGVKLPTPKQQDGNCAFCGGTINERSAFIFQLQDGSQRKACCPHCGLMAYANYEAVSAMATDFLYGRMVSVRQAVFLLDSRVSLCCSPSVLCFANEADARQFQLGFGGTIYSLEQATKQVAAKMSM